jgi:hypothetical protein
MSDTTNETEPTEIEKLTAEVAALRVELASAKAPPKPILRRDWDQVPHHKRMGLIKAGHIIV